MADAAAPGELHGARVLVVSNEQIAARMAGPAIRALHLARQLADRGALVTLATPAAIDGALPELDGIELAQFGMPSARRFRELGRAHDVVVTQPQRVDVAWGLHLSAASIVYDLYVPSYVERIAQLGTEPGDRRLKRRLLQRDRMEYDAALELGDAFICASERQRDHWLGALGHAGRLDLDLIERDPRADALVGVVPFGVPDAAPEPLDDAAPAAMRGTLVPADSIILLWTGGLWNWFDPVTVIEGLAQAREHEPRLRLVVMGVHHPEAAWEEQEASRAMRSRAAELGLIEAGAVVLCDSWIPYTERHRYLLEADLGVAAHHDSLETRLSFRTRFLDHLWCGLPTLTTTGGELTDDMIAAGAARGVDPGDVDGWAWALGELSADVETRRQMSVAARELGDARRWVHATSPLAAIVNARARSSANGAPRRASFVSLIRYCTLLVQVRVQAKGVRSLWDAARGAVSRGRE